MDGHDSDQTPPSGPGVTPAPWYVPPDDPRRPPAAETAPPPRSPTPLEFPLSAAVGPPAWPVGGGEGQADRATIPGPSTPPQFWPAPPQAAPVVHPTAPEPVSAGSSRVAWLVVALVAALLLVAGGVYVAVAGLPWASETASSSEGAPGKLPVDDPPAAGTDEDPPAVDTDEDPPPVDIPEGSPPFDPSRVGPLQPVSVTATCQAPSSVDSVGNTITYEPELTLDAVDGTAWRCAGSAVGERLVYDFGRPVTLASLGLIPGYAKVDPADGTDRFTENRTVTSVVWWFDDGTAQAQTIPSPRPTLATIQLAGGVTTSRVVLEIIGTGNDGAVRDFTAISEVDFTGY